MLELRTAHKHDPQIIHQIFHEIEATIEKDEMKQRIITAIADDYSRKILHAASERPVSAVELTSQYGIPVTTVYRRIEELIEAGLLASVKSGRTREGKWFDIYRSPIKSIRMSFEKELTVNVSVNEQVAFKFWRMQEATIS